MQKSDTKLTKAEKVFVRYVRAECKKHGVRCVFKNKPYLTINKIACSGYFDETRSILVVAVDRPDWVEILVHEYSHVTQWVDNCKEWRRMERYKSCVKMDEWLEGKQIKNPHFHLTVMRDLELDNEKRAVNLIKQFGLDTTINVEKYIQKANAYVSFYNYLKYTRRWSNPENSPYTNTKLISVMPKSFRMNYKKMSKRTYQAFVKAAV